MTRAAQSFLLRIFAVSRESTLFTLSRGDAEIFKGRFAARNW